MTMCNINDTYMARFLGFLPDSTDAIFEGILFTDGSLVVKSRKGPVFSVTFDCYDTFDEYMKASQGVTGVEYTIVFLEEPVDVDFDPIVREDVKEQSNGLEEEDDADEAEQEADTMMAGASYPDEPGNHLSEPMAVTDRFVFLREGDSDKLINLVRDLFKSSMNEEKKDVK